jgi:hypothetical protein
MVRPGKNAQLLVSSLCYNPLMSQATLTRKDIDDVLGVLDVMMTRIDERFTTTESTLTDTQKQMRQVLLRLDHIEKQLKISEDERIIMAHQLTRLHEWVEKVATRINVSFTH